MNTLYRTGWLIFRGVSLASRVKVRGREYIPATGPFILASNHISFLDPPIVGSCTGRELFFLAKRNLFETPIMGSVLRTVHAIPLNRGAIDRQAVALCMKALSNNYGLVVFPEGTRSKSDEFLRPKAGIGMLAIQAGCPIVPVYVYGTNQLLPCLLGKEQLSITFGEPFSREWVGSFPTEKDSYAHIADAVMERIAGIKQNVMALK